MTLNNKVESEFEDPDIFKLYGGDKDKIICKLKVIAWLKIALSESMISAKRSCNRRFPCLRPS